MNKIELINSIFYPRKSFSKKDEKDIMVLVVIEVLLPQKILIRLLDLKLLLTEVL